MMKSKECTKHKALPESLRFDYFVVTDAVVVAVVVVVVVVVAVVIIV